MEITTPELRDAVRKACRDSFIKGYKDGYSRAYKKFHWDLFDLIERHKPKPFTVDVKPKGLDEDFYVVE